MSAGFQTAPKCRDAAAEFSCQANDERSAQDLVDTVECSDVLLADRAYDSKALRQTLAAPT